MVTIAKAVFSETIVYANNPTISVLPEDVLIHIFKIHGFKGITAISQVCRAWKTCAKSESLWQFLLQKTFPDSILPTTAQEAYKYNLRACSNLAKAIYAVNSYEFDTVIRIIPSNSREFLFLKATHPVLASKYDSLVIWDVNAGEVVRAFDDKNLMKSVIHAQNSAQKIDLVISCSFWDGTETINVWDFEEGSCLKTIANEGLFFFVEPILINDGTQLVTRCPDPDSQCSLQVWDLRQLEVIKTLKGIKNDVIAIKASPDDSKIVFATRDTIYTWNLNAEGTEDVKTLTIPGKTYQPVSSLFLMEGLIISSHMDNSIHIWNRSGEYIKALENEEPVNSFKVDENGKLISIGSVHIVTWDIDSGNPILISDGTSDDVILSDDKKGMITYGLNGQIALHNRTTNNIFEVCAFSDTLSQHAALTADGKLSYVQGRHLLKTLDFGASDERILSELANEFVKAPNTAMDRFLQLPEKLKNEVYEEFDKIIPQGLVANEPGEGRDELDTIEQTKDILYRLSGDVLLMKTFEAINNFVARRYSKNTH